MVREIKFRVYLPDRVRYNKGVPIITKPRGYFIYFSNKDLIENNGEIIHELITHAEINVDEMDLSLVWQQYAGLKDKNGKEIYEGDILYSKMCNRSYTIGYRNYTNTLGDNMVFVEAHERDEVIGNIHENPF